MIRAQWAQSVGGRQLAAGALLSVVAACTDPRARPVPPTVDLSFAPGTVAHSPGDLDGALYAYDADGLAAVRLSLHSSDSTLTLDSALDLPDAFELNHSIHFKIPPGVPVGTALKVIGRAEDLVRFVTADTAVFFVQDTVSAAPSAPSPSRRKPL